MLRTKGEAGTGNVVEAVRHARQVQKELRMVQAMDEDELFVFAKQIQVCIILYVTSTTYCMLI
jgi:pyridoxal 5'-phosphate synthase pdxS subunit